LKNAGEIDRIPKLNGIQARACAPLWAVFEYGPSGLMWVAEGQTIADGIRVRNPIRGDAVLSQISKSHGKVISVDEDEIMSGYTSLARHGFYVEPTAAVVWEPLLNMVEELTNPIVVVLAGSGLKN
jgi:threonine synthase